MSLRSCGLRQAQCGRHRRIEARSRGVIRQKVLYIARMSEEISGTGFPNLPHPHVAALMRATASSMRTPPSHRSSISRRDPAEGTLYCADERRDIRDWLSEPTAPPCRCAHAGYGKLNADATVASKLDLAA